jgi:hypothetical protein
MTDFIILNTEGSLQEAAYKLKQIMKEHGFIIYRDNKTDVI